MNLYIQTLILLLFCYEFYIRLIVYDFLCTCSLKKINKGNIVKAKKKHAQHQDQRDIRN